MTVSSLCTYINLTSKCNPRKYAITRITPHQMAAGWTGQRCADYFCETERECSANYCIGMDGDIAQNVDEDCRAWTSASWDNDQRAITVEIANSYTGTDKINDASIEAFIDLCVDLMTRYTTIGDTLYYTGDTDGNLTLHEMFQSTNCPGAYFKSKIPYICEEVNKRLHPEPVSNWHDCIIWGSHGGDNQKWIIHNQDDGSIILESVAHPGFALDVEGAQAVNGAKVGIWPMHGEKNQRWFRDGQHIVSALDSNMCLDVMYAMDKEGTQVEIYERNDSDAQLWVLMEGTDGYVTIVNNHKNAKLCLDVSGG